MVRPRLQLGDAVVKVEAPVARCGVIDLDPVTGEKDGSLLKALAGYRPNSGGEPWFGVDARVVVPGVVRPGDPWSRRRGSTRSVMAGAVEV